MFLQREVGPQSPDPDGAAAGPSAVIQGIIPEQLPPTTIAADFLWGAGKFAVFTVHAPAGQDLRIEEILLKREGATDAIMPTVWVRMNRQRIYTETAFSAANEGDITIRTFPKSVLSETEEVRDTVIDEVAHRVLLNPPDSYTIPAGESAVVEIFGNINADALQNPTPVRFCLTSLRGSLIPTGSDPVGSATPAESRLNETCWSRMTVVPASS